jgi:hypothetical protein
MLRIERTAVQLTPRDTSNLRDTRQTTIVATSKGWVAIIRYGPEGEKSSNYAVYVHEILENYHPIGQAKFLEEALKRHASEAETVLRDGMRLI